MKKKKIRKLALVVFDKKSCTSEQYDQFYKEKFGNNSFIFIGEIPNAPGHCVIYNFRTERIEGMYHTDNFREATSEEV
jgi:hypothetical protein